MTNDLPSSTVASRPRGRPREFDPDQALDKALLVFSERGYHAASISELTEAMGLTPGSVYKAFKDKRAVFLAAFDRYRRVRRRELEEQVAAEPNGWEKILRTLLFYADSSCGAVGRRGCLVVGSATELALFDEEVSDRVNTAFDADERLLRELIRLGQSDGSIPAHVDVEAAARALLCLTKGMRVVGKTGRSPEEMVAVAKAAMRLIV
ncbi:TetR/AcrR family transcriptional regulator [Rhizobium sp. BK251]|uniref:TetR/AcrR family transcriptional regulator n=1 Tax=Rhizobium sp. BK251 TaxID=2512125 RepID=UPI001048E9AB|nr:TetR/AcrR family transcriptional regulator [Rhizobium sp. BK251]